MEGPTSQGQPQLLTLFFFSLFFLLHYSSVVLSSFLFFLPFRSYQFILSFFFFFYYSLTILRWLGFILFFSLLLSLGSDFWCFFFTRFGEFGYWGLKEKMKKVKAAPSYRYGAHKQLKILSDDKLSDGAKHTLCRVMRYFK